MNLENRPSLEDVRTMTCVACGDEYQLPRRAGRPRQVCGNVCAAARAATWVKRDVADRSAQERERWAADESHRERLKRYQREWHASRSPEWKLAARLRKHGLLPDEFYKLIEAQGGSCAICPTLEPDHVDHDHSCCPGPRSCGKCVRGVLCGNCNRGLGQFKDDPDRLRRAVGYLEGER